MAIHASTSVIIGAELQLQLRTFESLSVSQSIAEHNSFSLICRLDQLQNHTDDFADAFDIIGEKIMIYVSEWTNDPSNSENDGPHQFTFMGIITKIDIVKGEHDAGGDSAIITGKSATYFADHSSNFKTFEQQDLRDIIQTSFNDYTRHFQLVLLTTKAGQTISYSVRYNETPWTYIKRLAAQYGYWFYFDGTNLHFNSEPNDTAEASLEYGLNLQEFTIGMQPKFQKVAYFDTDYKDSGFVIRKNTGHTLQNQNQYIVLADAKANAFDSSHSKYWYNTSGDNLPKSSIFNDLVDNTTEANQARQIYLSGRSTCADLKLGGLVAINGENYHGTWRICHIDHYMSSDGHYSNNFECVLAEANYNITSMLQTFPKAETQIAFVKDNNDPDKLGRVKVRFPWQSRGELTPWIRLMNLYTGSEFGAQFIPELDTEVIIGFEGSNVERPYVMGQVYNNAKSPLDDWSTANNAIKGIKTKSGNMLIFNDEKGSITLKDKAGSSIVLDGNGNISISASGEVSLSGKKEVSLQSDDEVSLNGKKEVSLVSDDEISLNGKSEVSITSVSEVNVEAVNVTLTGTAAATLEGTNVTVNGTAMTEIKGGIVQIN